MPAAIDKLRRELQEAREALGQVRAARIAAEVNSALAGGEPSVALFLDEGGAEAARHAAKRIIAEPGRVALVAAASPDGVAVLAARAPGATFDCGAFVKRVTAALGRRHPCADRSARRRR